MIKPTIGRKLWYWPSNADRHIGLDYVPGPHNPPIVAHDFSQPCDATVVYVHSDNLVNLRVTDHNGNTHARTSVHLVQEGEAPDAGEAFAEWMPYQVGQAKKHEGEDGTKTSPPPPADPDAGKPSPTGD